MSGRARDAAGAAVLALLLGTASGVGWSVATAPGAEEVPVGDRVQAALDEFAGGDHVHVAPDARTRLSVADEARVEEAVAAADPALYVALWDADAEAGYWIEPDAADQLAANGPEDGVYVVWGGPGDVADAARGGRSPYLPSELFLGEARLRLPEVARAVEREGLGEEQGDYWGGTGGAVAAGVLLGGVAAPLTALLLVVGAWLARRRRLPGGWT